MTKSEILAWVDALEAAVIELPDDAKIHSFELNRFPVENGKAVNKTEIVMHLCAPINIEHVRGNQFEDWHSEYGYIAPNAKVWWREDDEHGTSDV